MNIEELMGLKELLMKQKNEDQCVVISNKRSFLPEDSSLFIKPLYTRKSVILSNINTNRAIEKVEKNIEEVLTNAIKYYGYNSQKIEEIFTMGIILDRDKYEQICEKLRKHSEIDILTKDICDKEILEATLPNIIELHPYLLKNYKNIDSWYREDDIEYTRWFGLTDLYNLKIYITSLQQKTEQLESIRKEAIEYVNKMWLAKLTPGTVSDTKFDLLNILNKGE